MPISSGEELSVQSQNVHQKDAGTNTDKLCQFKLLLLPDPSEGTVFRSNCLISLDRTAGCWSDSEAHKLWAHHLQDEGQKLWIGNVSKFIFPKRATCCPPSPSYNTKGSCLLVFYLLLQLWGMKWSQFKVQAVTKALFAPKPPTVYISFLFCWVL